MKILWLCNIALPKISESISKTPVTGGGWLAGLSNDLIKCENIQLIVVFPMLGIEKPLEGNVDRIDFFGFPKKNQSATKYEKNSEKYLEDVINKYKPDVIHIWGTEYPHTLSMVNVCKKLNKLDNMVISIQGLTSVIAKHYLANLPIKIIYRHTFRDFLRQDSIYQQREKFKKRGVYEVEALKQVKNIIGRTTWDKACTSQINPSAAYHFCNETLRDEFYKHKWSLNECEKYSIFISQGNYPRKGLHYMLEALCLIIKRFPEVHLYIAGGNINLKYGIKEKIRLSSYGKYIREMIKKNNLQSYLSFTGNLQEKQMCERFLKSHVFVSASTIENESNSISEAKLLGVPVVASFVGGVPSRIVNGQDGFIYQSDAPYMLAHHICEIFESDELALKFSDNAKKHASITHDREINLNKMVAIYEEIIQKS